MLFSTLAALAGAFLAVVAAFLVVVAFLAAGFFSAALAGALSSFLATVLTSTAFSTFLGSAFLLQKRECHTHRFLSTYRCIPLSF